MVNERLNFLSKKLKKDVNIKVVIHLLHFMTVIDYYYYYQADYY